MMGISLCMIVRDEADNLELCLQAALPWVDEVCIVDTGSTDDTVEIAERHGARVEHFTWCDDFSAARNVSLEMATMDWILVLDADEVLTPGSGPTLRKCVGKSDPQAWLIYQCNVDTQGREHPIAVPRLFRNDPAIRFSRPVHESVMPALRAIGHGDPATSEVRMRHTGYLPEALESRDKYARNARILRAWLGENPDDLFSWYKLAVSLRRVSERAEQLVAWERAYDLAGEMSRSDRLEHLFLPLLYDGYAEALVNAGDITSALRVVARGLSDLPHAVELIWRRGDIAWRVGDIESAERYLRACFRPRPVDARYAVRQRCRTVDPATRLAEVAVDRGDFDGALRHINRALEFDPTHRPARVLGVRVALLHGDVNGATLGLSELLDESPTCAAVRLLGGELAWLQGDTDGAEELWHGLDPRTDEGHEAQCRRAVAAVAECRFDEATALLDEITDRDLDTAAARLMVSVICGRAWRRSNAFRGERLMHRLIGWLRELMCAEADEALTRFSVNAADYAEELPGIEQLLQQDETAVA